MGRTNTEGIMLQKTCVSPLLESCTWGDMTKNYINKRVGKRNKAGKDMEAHSKEIKD